MANLLDILHGGITVGADEPGDWDALLAEARRCVEPVWREVSDLPAPGVVAGAWLAGRWRDVRVDIIRDGKVSIPSDLARAHRLDLGLMRKALSLDTDRGLHGDQRNNNCNCLNAPASGLRVVLPAYRQVLRELVRRTRGLLDSDVWTDDQYPDALLAELGRLKHETQLVLALIERRGYDTLTGRPRLGALERWWLGLRFRLAG